MTYGICDWSREKREEKRTELEQGKNKMTVIGVCVGVPNLLHIFQLLGKQIRKLRCSVL